MSTDCAHRISTGNPHWELARKADSSRLKPARNDNGSGRLAARLKPCPFKSRCPGTLVDYAQNTSSAMLCRRLKRQVRRERIRHGPFQPKQGGKLLVEKRSFWRFLRKPLKPFEDRCPRIEASWPRLISGFSTC